MLVCKVLYTRLSIFCLEYKITLCFLKKMGYFKLFNLGPYGVHWGVNILKTLGSILFIFSMYMGEKEISR